MNINAVKKHPSVKNVSLAGRLCDTLDVFPISKISDLSCAYVGNYVLFYNVGAYSLVFNMPFHCQTKPPVLMKTIDNDFKLIRKKVLLLKNYLLRKEVKYPNDFHNFKSN